MGLDNIGFVANMVNLVLYFMNVMHFSISGSANTTTNYLGTVFLLTLVGGLISDSYMNRLNTCLLFGGIELLVTKYFDRSSYASDKANFPRTLNKSTCRKNDTDSASCSITFANTVNRVNQCRFRF